MEWQYSSSNISSGSNSSSSSNINSSSDSSRNMAVTVAVRVAVTVAVTFSLKVISEMVKPRKRCGWYSVVPQVDRTPSRFKFRAELIKGSFVHSDSLHNLFGAHFGALRLGVSVCPFHFASPGVPKVCAHLST